MLLNDLLHLNFHSKKYSIYNKGKKISYAIDFKIATRKRKNLIIIIRLSQILRGSSLCTRLGPLTSSIENIHVSCVSVQQYNVQLMYKMCQTEDIH